MECWKWRLKKFVIVAGVWEHAEPPALGDFCKILPKIKLRLLEEIYNEYPSGPLIVKRMPSNTPTRRSNRYKFSDTFTIFCTHISIPHSLISLFKFDSFFISSEVN